VVRSTGAQASSLDSALRSAETILIATGDELENLVHAAERLNVVATYRMLIAPSGSASRGFTPDAAINRLSRFTGVRALRFVGFAAAHEDREAPELAAFLARARFLGHADDLRVLP